MSTWVFGCKLGLAQETCGRREADPHSRGAHLGGCPSCVHREPGNEETALAEERVELLSPSMRAFLRREAS